MNRNRIFIILIVVLIAVTGIVQFGQKKATPRNETVSMSPLVLRQIIASDTVRSDKTVNVAPGTTALTALKKFHATESKGVGINSFITSIDGRAAAADKKEFWAFYVNGKQAQVGAGSYRVKNHDTIEWKIETY